MALLNEGLSLWEIAFRWAGEDPDRRRLRLPLPVRDNFRTLVDAIHQGHLEAFNLWMEKRAEGSDVPPEFYIRHHLDAIDECVNGNRYPRAFLRFVRIERWAFNAWCQLRNIPLPEFWFPTGWNIEYAWSDDEEPAPKQAGAPESVEDQHVRLDRRHRIQMACQQVALAIWAKEPTLTIKEAAWRKEVQELAGGSEYEPETVEGWISKVDPRAPSTKRGRKRKNNSPPGDSSQ